MTLYFDEEKVRKALRREDLIAAMEKALIEFSAGRVTQPPRQFFPVEKYNGFFGLMPAITDESMGVKLLTFYPENVKNNLPTHLAVVILFSSETGEVLAVMDGRLITEMRTAAVSAVATRLLAPPESKVLAILGSGVQARSHAKFLRKVCNFAEVLVWSRTPAHAQQFAEDIGAKYVPVVEDAVRGADVVVTATSATESILFGDWLKPGVHVNAIGWNGTTSRELDDKAMHNVLFVESREAALRESGDVILSKATVYAELGEVLASKKPLRAGEITVFKSLGMAIEDIAAARLVYEKAGGNEC